MIIEFLLESDRSLYEEKLASRGRSRRNTLQVHTTPITPVLEPLPLPKSFLPPIFGAMKPSTYESPAPPSSEPPHPIMHPRRRQIIPRNVT
jgi:hypothetical protein